MSSRSRSPPAPSPPSPPPPAVVSPPPALVGTAFANAPADASAIATPPKPGFMSLCHSLHDLLEAGRYRQVWDAANDILTRALKLIDPITADFLRDDDDGESASMFLLFHEYLLYSITAPGWALILALQHADVCLSQPTSPLELYPEIAGQILNFFTGAQKIANSLCRIVLVNSKGSVSLVERTWRIRAMLLEETRQAIESLYDVDTKMVAKAARGPFGKEATMEPWQVLETLIPGELKLRLKTNMGDLLRGWAEEGEDSDEGTR